ncbi:helix-turn-helix domain-containing protein [Archangium gephyra]|uniref:helix-turn-helix domain-containing protein n=1 Tax=Archangium gephyra TaxID=48 RepID=UPI0035D4ECF4
MSALLDVDEAATRLRCSRRRVFELLADGTLARGPKYGRRTVITAESVADALVASESAPCPAAEAAPKRRAPRSLKAGLDALAEQQRAAWKTSDTRSPRRGRTQ